MGEYSTWTGSIKLDPPLNKYEKSLFEKLDTDLFADNHVTKDEYFRHVKKVFPNATKDASDTLKELLLYGWLSFSVYGDDEFVIEEGVSIIMWRRICTIYALCYLVARDS